MGYGLWGHKELAMTEQPSTCIYRIEYYSVIKKNEIMSIAATWMQPETIILRETSREERQIPYDITYTWNLNYDTDEPIYETESWTQRTDWWLPRGRRLMEGWSRMLGLADVSYYIQNGKTARSYCIAQGSIINIM